jgi:hypothetical protein
MGDTLLPAVSKLSLGSTEARVLTLEGVSRLEQSVDGQGFSEGGLVKARSGRSGRSGSLLVLSVRDRWRTLGFTGGAQMSITSSPARRFDIEALADSGRLDCNLGVNTK